MPEIMFRRILMSMWSLRPFSLVSLSWSGIMSHSLLIVAKWGFLANMPDQLKESRVKDS